MSTTKKFNYLNILYINREVLQGIYFLYALNVFCHYVVSFTYERLK